MFCRKITAFCPLLLAGNVMASGVVTAPKPSSAAGRKISETKKRVEVEKLIGQFGLNWNLGPGAVKCEKITKDSEIYSQIRKSKCKFLPGASALAEFSGQYVECYIGEYRSINWRIFPTEKICQDQIVMLNNPSP